jgi:hypothetical protein
VDAGLPRADIEFAGVSEALPSAPSGAMTMIARFLRNELSGPNSVQSGFVLQFSDQYSIVKHLAPGSFPGFSSK